MKRRALAATTAASVLALGLAGPAKAAESRVRFAIAPKPYAEALLDLAQQANITLIGAGACVGSSREGLSGVMTVEQALSKLLGGATCNWRLIAPGAVEITPAARSGAQAATPIAVSEVLVTATKRVRDPRQLAVSMTAVTGRDLQATGASDAAEGAAQLDILSTNLGPGRDKLLLRGLSDGAYTGRARSTVATYLDDIPINYNAPDPDLRLVDVERVEIARGPQSTLYGAGFLSGLYRIVSKKPDLGAFSTEVRASGAITQEGGVSHSVEGYFNAPIWWDLAGVRLSAYNEVNGGYLDDIGLERKDANRTQRAGGRLTFLVQNPGDWSVEVTAAGQHLYSDDTQYTFPNLGLRRVNHILEPHVNDIGLVTTRIDKQWGWGELTSSTGVVRHNYGSFYDATSVQDSFTSHAQTSAYSEKARTTMIVEDIFLASRGAGPLQWLGGLYASSTEEHSPSNFLAQLSFAPNVPVYTDDRHDRIAELAAYGEVSYAITPDWTVAVGGRAFSIRTRTTSRVDSEQADPRRLQRDATFRSVAPKISIQHELSTGDMIYAVMSQGYRPGGVNTGGVVALPDNLETFSADRLTNYEIGTKLQFWNERLTLNSAVFYDIWKDIQSDQYRPSGIPFTTNAGDAAILGWEGEVDLRLNNGLSAQLNGRVSRSRVTHVNPLFGATLINGLPDAPAFSGGAVVSYERPLFRDWRIRLLGETTYIGESRVNFSSTTQVMGGYVRTKLLAEIRRRSLGLQLYVTNPTNAFSDTFAFGNPFNPAQIQQVTPQRPRTIGLTLFAAY